MENKLSLRQLSITMTISISFPRIYIALTPSVPLLGETQSLLKRPFGDIDEDEVLAQKKRIKTAADAVDRVIFIIED